MSRVMYVMALFYAGTLSAQTVSDALRFSQVYYGGTARYMSMGSSMNALGGDFSVLGSNPAGLALFRSNQFTFSPGLESITVDTESYGDEFTENIANLGVFNLGLVSTTETQDQYNPWRFFNFGVGVRRNRTFHADEIISARQDVSSLSRHLANLASGIPSDEFLDADPFFLFPAYEAFIFDPLEGGPLDFYMGSVEEGQEVRQTTRIQSEGRSSETLIGVGANYEDRLYLGFSLGLQRFVFEETFSYGEQVINPDTASISSFGYRQTVETLGDGINIRLGAIYRVNQMLRLGAAYTSPTWSSFETNFATDWSSVFTDGFNESFESEVGFNSYNLRSPHRLSGSLGLVIGKRGLFNVEYEYVDFGRMRFNDTNETPIDFSGDNQEIREIHVSTGIIRAGGEFRAQPFSFRAGYELRPNPYREGVTQFSDDMHVFSGGLGVTLKNVNLDLAYRLQQSSADFIAYQDPTLETARLDFRQDIIVFTLGIRY